MTRYITWVSVRYTITPDEKKANDEHVEWLKKYGSTDIRPMFSDRNVMRMEFDANSPDDVPALIDEEIKSGIWSRVRTIKSYKIGKIIPKPPRAHYCPMPIVVKYVKPGAFRDTCYRTFETMAEVDDFLNDGWATPITRAAIYTLTELRDTRT